MKVFLKKVPGFVKNSKYYILLYLFIFFEVGISKGEDVNYFEFSCCGAEDYIYLDPSLSASDTSWFFLKDCNEKKATKIINFTFDKKIASIRVYVTLKKEGADHLVCITNRNELKGDLKDSLGLK